MHPFDEMKDYVRFTEQDEELLRTFFPYVEPYLRRLAVQFYQRIEEFPDAHAVFRDQAQVERLQRTLQVWARELLTGPWDHAYYERHRRIGQVHVAVGLPHRFMFTAMSLIRDELCDIAHSSGLPASDQLCRTIGRVTNLDLAVMCGTYMDERERRELATLQHLLVSHLPIAVLVIDNAGRITTSTEPAFRLLGQGSLIGRAWHEALPSELLRASELPARVEQALSSTHSMCLPRVDVTLEGEPRTFRIDVVPICHELAGFLIHVEELTSTVQTEIRLQRSEALARLGALSAAVAHELRNPLAGLSGALQVMANTFEAGDPRRGIIGQVLDQVRRMDALVSDLLAFARPRPPTPSNLDLRVAAEEVARNIRPGHPGIEVHVHGAGMAWADPDHVHRILLNLVNNAAQALHGKGQVDLHVTAGKVEVRDNGPGVPSDVAGRIFEPFFTTRTQGTGLGLAICRQSADAMAGTITLKTGVGPGATFALSLPHARGSGR